MRIDRVSLTLFAWDGIPPTRYHAASRMETGSSALGLLSIGTDAGLTGHAFLGSATHTAANDGPGLIRFLKPLLMGRDPLEREAINAKLWPFSRLVSVRSIGAVDVALWDLAGKAAGMPIHRLLGTCRHSIPAYASSQVLDGAEAYAAEAVAFRDAGWAAYKIHPPQHPPTDIKVCEAVRRAVGEDFPLMLDSTWSYNYYQALKVGRAIEELGFLWFEDPLSEWEIPNYVKLKQKLDIPIMATEYPAAGLESYAPWIMLQATDYLRGDVAVKGGITTLLKTAHLAEAFRMTYEIHHGGNSLNNLANLHVACAIRNTTYFEVLLPDGAHKYGLAREIEVGRDGMVQAPEGPGLGAEIDFELIARKTVAVLD
ncbi:MAG: enolase C-terminal domain-like protein [Paracraurococcus sp.]